MANNIDTLTRTFDNYCRCWLMCTEIVGNGATQAQIDALLSTAEGAGVVMPKMNYKAGDQNYDWTGYQAQLGKIMGDLRTMIIRLQGPFQVNSIAR
jgi:hypothetical protein